MKKKHIIIFVLIGLVSVAIFFVFLQIIKKPDTIKNPAAIQMWDFQAIDTMKYSRDPIQDQMDNPEYKKMIDAQVKAISQTGATHVAIATPYDEKFLPGLKLWVEAARKYELKVWFRGNFSGWEKWFGFKKISRTQHKELTQKFILNNPTLFEDGDVFSPCPECENGGPGDPRSTRDIKGFRQFMIDERTIAKESFEKIGKRVEPNFASMNGDVARLIMDPSTTAKMGGIVVIDHYVSDPKDLATDALEIAKLSGGKVVLGEYGAPIPDINGEMTEEMQAQWTKEALADVVNKPEIVGLSYWTSFGGSTKAWNDDGTPRKVVSVIKSYYSPEPTVVKVVDQDGNALSRALVTTNRDYYETNQDGLAKAYLFKGEHMTVQKVGYETYEMNINNSDKEVEIRLRKISSDNFMERLLERLNLT